MKRTQNNQAAEPLFDVPQSESVAGPIETSVIDVIAQLTEQGLMVSKYQAIGTTIISLAKAVDRGMSSASARGVSVATSNLAKLLVESLNELPEPVTGQDPFYDALDAQLQAATSEALG
ncbi:MAG: hypothetical protein KH751_08350 [Actinomyces sp.]|nr:hypothetical protein [Actinomyces sp.]